MLLKNSSITVLLVLWVAAFAQACTSSANDSVEMQAGTPRNCGNDHPAVGSEAEFATLFHKVSGTLRVIDNCTLQIDNFIYDGRGPEVFFFAGVNQDYTGPGYFQLGERLNGPTYDGDTVVVDIPEGKTLDDFNSLSVWCTEFGINFGDAFWGDTQP